MNRSLLIRVLPLGKIVFLKRDALGRLMYVWFSPVDWSWLLLLQGQNDLSPSLGNEMIDKDETEFKLICFFSFFGFIYFFTLQDCIGFAMHWHESTMVVQVFPILNPPPTSFPIPSLQVIPAHQHPVSCIKPGLAIHFTYDNLHVSMPFFHIIPPSPSPAESKRLFYTSVSLFLPHIQGYCYHLSKFHIYVLVYCICVYLSGLLHCIIGSSFIHLIRTDSNAFFLVAE